MPCFLIPMSARNMRSHRRSTNSGSSPISTGFSRVSRETWIASAPPPPDGRPRDMPIREGEVVLVPGHCRHSPQRPAGSIGLVVEKVRPREVDDAFEWYCPSCWALVHRAEVNVQNIVQDLPPLFEAFYAGRRRCPQCGHVHPGKA